MSDKAPQAPKIDGLDLDRVRAVVGKNLFGEDAAPPKLGRYVVKSTLGEGAMGRVYLAEDETLKRPVAVKVIRAEERPSPERLQERLAKEARRLAAVAHPNVAAVYDVGVEGDQVYIAMEYIEGKSLRGWLATDPSRRAILQVFRAAGRGLAAAHAAGLVHRDFKPENVLVGLRGSKVERVCVVDFGLATASLEQTNSGEGVRAPMESSTTTAAGTPAYMSPETLSGSRADTRSDQYAFCVSLYEALFGERPYEAKTVPQLAIAIDTTDPDFDRDAPRWLLAALERGLARDPAARFESMDALLAGLRPPRRRTFLPMLAGAAVLAGVTTAVVLSLGPDTEPCEQTASLLAEVWGDPRRREIEQAFAGFSFGPETGERVFPKIDAWSQDWVARRDAACRTMVDAGEVERFDRVNACFDRRLRSVDEMLGRWANGDAAVASGAAAAVDQLPDLDVCIADAALEDPAVDELRQRIGGAKAFAARGDVERAESEYLAITEAATRLGSAEVALEAELSLAYMRLSAGRVDEAEATLEAGYFEAQRIGSDALAGKAAAAMAGLKIGPRADPNGADAWVKHAVAALEREPNPFVRHHVRITKAWLEQKRRNFDLALVELDAALETAEGEPRIAALERKAHVLWDMGRFDESEELSRAALAACRERFGDKHPECAPRIGALGRYAMRKGDVEATNKAYREAIALVDEAYGPGQLSTAPMLGNLGLVALARGDYPEAKNTLTRSLELFAAHYGEGHERVGGLLKELAQAEMALDELDNARAHAERALAIEMQLFGPDRVESARILRIIASIARKDGRPQDALKSARESLAIVDRLAVPHPLDRARANVDVGMALTDLDRPDEAIPVLERAVEQFTQGHPGPHSDTQTSLAMLADAYDAAGRSADARKATARASEISAALGEAPG